MNRKDTEETYTEIKSEYVTFRNAAEKCSDEFRYMAQDIVDEISEILERMEYYDIELHTFFPVIEMSGEEIEMHLKKIERDLN